jgi:Fe-S-cluster containining protein
MNNNSFNCKKCGFCCRTLLEYENNLLMGMVLFEEERKLFNEKDVIPQRSIGNDQPSEILSYQLRLAVCPHISKENKCLIYDKRPLACKAFPITSTIGKNIADLKCPQISKWTKEQLYNLEFSDDVEEAMDKIIEIVGSHIGKRGELNFWFFDIASNKWVLERNPKKVIAEP